MRCLPDRPIAKWKDSYEKAWILQPADDSAAPWLPFHNRMFEFVVRASNHRMKRNRESRLPSKQLMKGRMLGSPHVSLVALS
jgi:hypothetical protein